MAVRGVCRLQTDEIGWHKSAKYVGASPCSALNVSKHNLNWTRCGTESQWGGLAARVWCDHASLRRPVISLLCTERTAGDRVGVVEPRPTDVAIVNSGDDKAVDYCFCHVQRQCSHAALYTTKLCYIHVLPKSQRLTKLKWMLKRIQAYWLTVFRNVKVKYCSGNWAVLYSNNNNNATTCESSRRRVRFHLFSILLPVGLCFNKFSVQTARVY